MRQAEDGESASNSRRDPLIGSVVNGKYRVESAIARGGMGRIYYASQVPLERPVALKVVQGDGEHEHESQFLKRFLQEASILAKLQHPNVVTLFDYGRIENSHVEQYFIAMEFLAGETLTHRFKTRGRLSPAETLVMARQIVRGLREAHKRGIVHRDLKPSNIILVPEGDGSELVKLVDFGIGKVVGRTGDTQDLTQDGVFVGTPRYMAPEQFEGHAYPASDLYALGTIMFQALAGDIPFQGANMAELMVAKLARPVPTFRDVAPDLEIPPNLETFILSLLARPHEQRPTMEEIAQMLAVCEDEVFGAHGNALSSSGGSWPRAAHGFGITGPQPMVTTSVSSTSNRLSVTPDPSSRHAMRIAQGAMPASQPPHSAHPPHGSGYHGEPLRVPHTVVAPIPNIASYTPPPQHLAQVTSQPAEPRRSKTPLVIPLLLVALGLGGVFVWWKVAHPTPAIDPAALSGTSGSTTAAGASLPDTPAVPATFTLVIDSTPSGASVFEGETSLGNTPLTLPVDRATVATSPRTFTVKKDGFVASQVVQGATTEATARSNVSLAPDPAASAKKVPIKPQVTAVTTPPKPPTPSTAAGTSTTQPGIDIRLKR